ncbi:MAG TPA: hypothetical protein VM290_00530 [Gaiellaceae bacterium]|nr:hypothetical protein [Gaiellaceae bacterium]
MGRPRSGSPNRPLPPPLPPGQRTVGQLVAEAVRLYGRRFWPALLVGIGPAALGLLASRVDRTTALVVSATAGALVLALAFVLATRIATGVTGAPWATAVVAGTIVFAPFALLVQALVFPGVLWLALVGLAVPAIVVERLGLVAGFRRGLELARADFVHALGGFAALWLVVFLTQTVLAFVLRGQADQTLQTAVLLASVVVSPVFFLGGALLHADQAARVVDSGSRKPRKGRRDAALHPALDADGAGGADAEVEPRAAARGEP